MRRCAITGPGFEALPSQIEFGALTRDQQLAYWLNLYNARVLEIVAAHYPDETTKILRSAPGDPEAGIWHEKTLNIKGVALSLVDVEQQILFPIWDDPLVLYGLWQGAIGGPKLPVRAYSAQNVWKVLRENAREFVNSNRGTRPNGRALSVYGWGEPLFESDVQLSAHLASWLEEPFVNGFEQTSKIKRRLYNWHLADMSGGSHHQGQWNHTAAYLASLPPGPMSQLINQRQHKTISFTVDD